MADLTSSASLMRVSTVSQVYSSVHRNIGMLVMQICIERPQMEICLASQLSTTEYVLRVSRNECMSHALTAIRTKIQHAKFYEVLVMITKLLGFEQQSSKKFMKPTFYKIIFRPYWLYKRRPG